MVTKHLVCQKNGCNKEATHEVVLELRNNPRHPPAYSTPLVIACEEHAQVTWAEMVPDEFWDRLARSFVSNHAAVPSKRYSKLVIRPLGENS